MSEMPFGVPIPGPIGSDPSARLGQDSLRSAAEMLAAAVRELEAAGVELGAYDRRVLAWLADCGQPTVAVVASLLHRAVQAAPGGGGERG